MTGRPALDCHAHIAPDVTGPQIEGLDGAHVFAVSRSLSEADAASRRVPDPTITWGLGIHPGLARARAAFDATAFAQALPRFGLVGEVGLDRKAGDLPGQMTILSDVLRHCQDQPVLISLHSNGATAEIGELLARHPHPGAILHWYLGTAQEARFAAELGAYFSVNAAMSDDILAALPADRVLPETDFARPGRRGKKPGDTGAVELRLAGIWDAPIADVRHRCWANLRRLAVAAGALDRLAEATADLLLEV